MSSGAPLPYPTSPTLYINTTAAAYAPAISSPQPWTTPAVPPTQLFVVTPAVNLPHYEFHAIADCFWTLIVGAAGGWLAMLIHGRRRQTPPAQELGAGA